MLGRPYTLKIPHAEFECKFFLSDGSFTGGAAMSGAWLEWRYVHKHVGRKEEVWEWLKKADRSELTHQFLTRHGLDKTAVVRSRHSYTAARQNAVGDSSPRAGGDLHQSRGTGNRC